MGYLYKEQASKCIILMQFNIEFENICAWITVMSIMMICGYAYVWCKCVGMIKVRKEIFIELRGTYREKDMAPGSAYDLSLGENS